MYNKKSRWKVFKYILSFQKIKIWKGNHFFSYLDKHLCNFQQEISQFTKRKITRDAPIPEPEECSMLFKHLSIYRNPNVAYQNPNFVYYYPLDMFAYTNNSRMTMKLSPKIDIHYSYGTILKACKLLWASESQRVIIHHVSNKKNRPWG